MATTGEVVEDAEAGLTRVQGKSLKDGKEGWITLKGNAGTIFAELTPNVYTVLKDVNVYKRHGGGSDDVVGKLAVGESFQVLEGPKQDKAEAERRIKVRASRDKAVGWVSDKP